MNFTPESKFSRKIFLKAHTSEQQLSKLITFLKEIKDSLEAYPWFEELEFYFYYESEKLNKALELYNLSQTVLYGNTFFIFITLSNAYRLITNEGNNPEIIFVGDPPSKFAGKVSKKLTEQWLEINDLLYHANQK